MADEETLLTPSSIKLFGRLVAGITLDPKQVPIGLGANQFLRAQLAVEDARLARIYGFSHMGHYTELTGFAPDPSALALYRLRWALTDLAEFLAWFRSPHTRTSDIETAWQGLADTVETLKTFPAP